MTKRKWTWPYSNEATIDSDASIVWTSHDHKASTRQSGKSFLADGPPDFEPINSVSADVVREMTSVVRVLLKQLGGKP